MSVRTIEQKIAAGSRFNGAAPTTDKILGNDMESFPEDTVGGLFDFENDNPIRIEQISIKFGGQLTWSLALVDIDAVEVVVLSGTTNVTLWDSTTRPIVLQGQKLKLVTSGATAAMRCRISASTL